MMKEYLSFLRYCLDASMLLPESTNKIDWKVMMTWAEKQAIVGVIFSGIERAGNVLSIPFDTLMEWIGYARQIELRNSLVNIKCVDVVDELKEKEYECLILKGQGNAMMYLAPMRRTPGDIDVWVVNVKRNKLRQYVVSNQAVLGYHYEHIEYEEGGVPIEVHFMPGVMNNPIYNRRLQAFCRKMANEERVMVELPDGVGSIPIPTVEFNIVFQLAHMMHHFFDEGIGLRQMIDYYFLLKARNNDVRCKMEDVRDTLKYLNLYNFAGAVMYIMKEVLGLDEKYLIVPVDERRGKTLLNEILKGGNFGHHSGLAQNNAAKKYFQKTWRNMQLVKEYPSEALCEPFFRTWHYFWRMTHC